MAGDSESILYEASDSDMSISDEEDCYTDQGEEDDFDANLKSDNDDAMEEDDTPGESDSESVQHDDVEYVDDEDNEINMGAYDTDEVSANGLQSTEQAGVLHLVHGWIQRGNPERVSMANGSIANGSINLAHSRF